MGHAKGHVGLAGFGAELGLQVSRGEKEEEAEGERVWAFGPKLKME